MPSEKQISWVSSEPSEDSSGNCLLELNGVTKIFDSGMTGVERVSFHLRKGEFVYLMGPNRSGKTTLLRLITFEVTPTRGEIVFDGLSSRYLKKSQISPWRKKLGLIMDDLTLIYDLNVFDNIALSLRVMGKVEKKIRQQVRQTLDMVGLSSKSQNLPAKLSSAEQQKVAIARAIVRNPLLLLADEPTRNMDEESAREIEELFHKINLFGTSVLITSTESFQDNGFPVRVIKMEKGRVVEPDLFRSRTHLLKVHQNHGSTGQKE